MPRKQVRKKAARRRTSTRRSTPAKKRAKAKTTVTKEAESTDNACGVYTAEGGETLEALAAQFKVDADLLTAINPFLDANVSLAPFDQVNIPAADFDLSILEPVVKKARSQTRSATRGVASEESFLDLEPESMALEETGPGWYEVALEEMTEVGEQDPAPRQDLRYLRYLMTTNMESTNDESGCASAFVHWCLIRAGLLGTASTSAFSWLEWTGGQLLHRSQPKLGAIVVFGPGREHLSQGPHVAFYAGPDDDSEDTILALGCHLDHYPSILPYPSERIISYCWPIA